MNHTCLGLLAALVVAAPAALDAQAVIRGTVVSDRGDPIAAANVVIAEFNLVVPTNVTGQYTISIAGGRVQGQAVTLRARAVGFKQAARSVTLTPGEQTIDFTLVFDVNLLEAIVVTGVQEATAATKVPWATTQLDIAQMPVAGANPLSQLQGKVPGANIVSANGRPGAQPSVLLRGPASINAAGRSQEPLYIVDGVAINGSLPDLNPQDIETVEVVKGAAGSSLYGARAGQGVVSIRTKSGSRALEGFEFGVRSEAGIGDIERDFGLARFHALVTDETGLQFCQAVTGQPVCARTFDYRFEQARINNAAGDFALSPPGFTVDPGAVISGAPLRQRFQITPWPGTAYNAVRQVVDPQPYTENSLDATGRFGTTRFYASASNLTQQGAIRFLDGFQRNSFRLNVDQAIGTEWNLALRTFYSRSTEDGLNQDGGGQAFFRLTRVPAIVNVLQLDTLGRLYIRPNLQGGGAQNENPLSTLFQIDRVDVTNRFIGGLTLQYSPLAWLTIDGNVSYDLRRLTQHDLRDKGLRTPTNTPGTNNGFIFRGTEGEEAFNASLNAGFRRDFSPDLRTRYSLRYSFEQNDGVDQEGQGNFLAIKGVTALNNVRSDTRVTTSEATRVRRIGLSAGAGLEYKDRYILDGVIRRDGSSLFGAANRWDTFGRASVAWRAALEPWWPLHDVNELKLRASYGTAGNSPRFSAQYETFTIAAGGIPSMQFLGNRNLRPEKNREVEVGADVEVLGRYGLGVTYARSEVVDQILPVPVSASTGFQNQWLNAGTLERKTWELSINLPIIQGNDVSWSWRFIYDRNRSTITKLDVPPFFFGTNLQATDQIFQAIEGERFGTFYGRKFLTSCSELPGAFAADCGVPGVSSFQFNDEGWLVWVGAGNNPGMGITNNLWETQLTAGSAPWGVGVNWGMPIIMRGGGSTGTSAQIVPLGNALPDFRFAISQNFRYKRLTVYGLLDASIGQDVWNQGFHWAHLDFLSKDVDQAGKSVETAKPIGYYYRAPAPEAGGLGGFYDILGPNNFSVEEASYAKLRELLVSFHVGPISGVGNWDVSVLGRNLFTITDYRGFDPEVGHAGVPGNNQSAGSAAINAIDSFTFPNLRSVTIALSTRF